MRLARYFAMALAASVLPAAHAAVCTTSAVPTVVRSEGLTEPLGDVALTCTGAANERFATNMLIFLSVNVTNRLDADGTLTGIDFAFSTGGDFAIVPDVRARLNGANGIAFNGISLQLSPAGALQMRVRGLRGAVAQQGVESRNPIAATLTLSGPTSVPVSNPRVAIGFPFRSLLLGSNSAFVNCLGSPAPDDVTMAALTAAGSAPATQRVTEGFIEAFQERTAGAVGTRFLVRYRGFPAGARLFVPDVIAGSSALVQTAGGDLKLPPSGGRYQATAEGSLLLARVEGADDAGTRGTPVFSPGAPGSEPVSFNGATEVTLSGGNGFVVYEVVDANPVLRENAHIPTFIAFPRFGEAPPPASVAIVLAPVSTVVRASETAPVPRFIEAEPEPDCETLGDCAAFPRLQTSNLKPLSFTAPAGSRPQASFNGVINVGGGTLSWNASIAYTSGSGWASLYTEPNRGRTPGMLRVIVDPSNLAPGTYEATVTVDAGSQAGSVTIPVTLVVTAPAPVVAKPAVAAVVNAASFAPGPLVPGSIATVWGERFDGKDLSVMFDNLPAQVFYKGSGQINLLVPAELNGRQSAQLVLTVDGQASAPLLVQLAPINPAIFPRGVLNQDYSVNSAEAPAVPGSVLQIFATGLPSTQDGTVTARLGDRDIAPLEWAGLAPGFQGLWQVNLRVPEGMAAGTAELMLCGVSHSTAQRVCSPAAKVAIR